LIYLVIKWFAFDNPSAEKTTQSLDVTVEKSIQFNKMITPHERQMFLTVAWACPRLWFVVIKERGLTKQLEIEAYQSIAAVEEKF